MLKVLSHPLSTFSRRVQIALIEKDIPHELVTVDMAKREHRTPEHLAKNPYGRVPVLVDDEFVLYESTAILSYLEATHPEPPLMPSDARRRALTEMHMKLCDLELGRNAGQIMFAKRFLPEDKWDKEAMSKAQKVIGRHLEILAGQLAGQRYVVGDQFTLADVCYIPFVEFLPLMEVEVPSAVADWAETLLARPSSVKTRPAM